MKRTIEEWKEYVKPFGGMIMNILSDWEEDAEIEHNTGYSKGYDQGFTRGLNHNNK